jgi:TP901 family phage tail tape measure protein
MSEAATDILLRIRVDVTNVQAIASLGAALDKAQRSMANIDNANKKVGKSTGLVMGMYEKFSNRLNRVERSMDAVFRAGVHLQAMGRDLLGFGKKMTGWLSKATDAWGDFEFMLNRAAGAMDVFDNQSQMYQDLKNGIMEAARELRIFPAEEVAKAMYYWQSTTGQTIDSQKKLKIAIEGVKTAMKVAALTQTDYEQVIKGAYSIMRQYGLQLTDIPAILKDLFLMTQRTSLEYADLIQSFKYTGPIAKLLGGSYKEVAKWLGIIGDLGQRGSMSGRGLGMMFTQLVRPSDKAKKAYDKLFLATMNVKKGYDKLVFPKGKFIGFEKWISLLAKATAGLTQKQKLQYLTTITGTQNSARIVLPLIDAQQRAIKKGQDIFKEGKYSLANSAKVFDKAWGLLSQSWKGTVGLLKQTVMPMFLILGENIAKVLTPVLNSLSEALFDAKPAFEDVAKTVTESFAPAIKTVGDMMVKAVKWFKENPKMVKQIVTWVALGTVIATVAGAIMLAVGTLIFFINTIILVVAGMMPMLLTIGLLIGAFILLGTKIYQNVGGIKDAIGVLVNSIIDAFNRLFGGTEGVGKGLNGLWENINKVIDDGLKVLAGWIIKVADAIDKLTPEDVETMKGIAGALLAIAATWKGLNLLNDSFKALNESLRGFKAVASGLGTVASTIAGIPGMISSLPGLLTGIGTGIRAIGAALAANPIGLAITLIIGAILAFVAAYETNFLGFKDFIDGLVQWFVTNVGPVIAGVFTWLQQVIPPILQGIADFVNNVLVPAFNQLVTWISETFGPMFEQAGATLQAFLDFIGLLPTVIGEVVAAVIAWIESLGIDWDLVWTNISIAINVAIETIKTIIGAGLAFIWSIWNAAWSVISTFLKNLIEGIVKFITGFWQIIEGIFEVATGILTGNWEKVWNGIEDIVRGVLGMIEGVIRSGFAVVQSIISGALTFIDTLFKTIFGEGEGSIYWSIKGFIDTITTFGGMIIEGFIEGVKGAINWAISNAKSLFESIINGIKGFLGIKSPATIMLDIGKNIVAGLWKGINDAKDWIIDKVIGFIKNVIPGPILDALGIHSPSTVMAAIGENIVKGLAVGIERTDDAYNAMVSQANGIVSAMNGMSETATAVSGAFSSSTTSDSTKQIDLNVNVTSGDGSVSGLDMATLSSLITGSDMVRALEHMATVD